MAELRNPVQVAGHCCAVDCEESFMRPLYLMIDWNNQEFDLPKDWETHTDVTKAQVYFTCPKHRVTAVHRPPEYEVINRGR
jgi:hypothetical protein